LTYKPSEELFVNKVPKVVFLFLFVLVFPVTVRSQGYAGDAATSEPLMIIDKPTAGMLKRGEFELTSNFYEQGGILVGINVGVFDQFSFGVSYGGTDIIGSSRIGWNPEPGVNARFRIINENFVMPAIALGFDSQGKEPFLDADSLRRYTIKSPGFFAAASKNYSILGNLSIHGGLNMTLERHDGDKDLDAYVGGEKSIGRDISLFGEYDFGFNDDQTIGRGRGYLNLSLRWSWGKGLVVGFDLKNVTKNQQNISIGTRTIEIDYVGEF